LELFGILRNLSDQIYSFRIEEPPGILLQDLQRRPLRRRHVLRDSKFESRMTPAAMWQMRMNDVPACLARTRLPRATSRFNLELADPIEPYLDDASPWTGVAGVYRVELGMPCSAVPGRDPTLPTLRASVNAFTRLWLGVRPATGLAATDDLDGPAALLDTLDTDMCMPTPYLDWDF
ncbi:MAG: GNAT family N-acetyltransferase, partial [Planctomycetota bacterium]